MSRYTGVLWLGGQADQKHPGAIDFGEDRVRVYVADQIVADWPRSEVRFTDAGSHFEITAENETLGFTTDAADAFKAAAGLGGLAARIAQVTETRQDPMIATTQPVQMLPQPVAQPKKRRRWPWVVGTLILIGMIANAGEDNGSLSSTTRTSRANSGTVTALAEVNESCQAYATQLLPLMLDAAVAAGEGADAAFAAADGDITFDQAAAALNETANTLADTIERIDDLGSPPPELSQAVTLLIRGFSDLEAGFSLGALGAQQRDVDLIEQGNQRMDDGNALVERAEQAIGTC